MWLITISGKEVTKYKIPGEEQASCFLKISLLKINFSETT